MGPVIKQKLMKLAPVVGSYQANGKMNGKELKLIQNSSGLDKIRFSK